MRAMLTAFTEAIQKTIPDMPFSLHTPMASCTTLKLGGPADILVEPATESQLQAVLRLAKDMDVPVTVIGHGSNLLVLDGGIRGLVIRIGRNMADIRVAGTEIICGAGAMMGQAAVTAANAGLAGLAFASGIPGTVGGGAVMNAGAYGGEMSQVVTAVRGVTLEGTPISWQAEELAYGYRTSRLQQEQVIVTEVTCSLTAGDKAAILEEMARLNRQRAEKQPLEYPSAGSTFKRPVGGYAAAMIDGCGLKGYMLGGAQVSEKHAGFLLNRGGTAKDFTDLMAHVTACVQRKWHVTLEPEVKILGEA